MAHEPFGIFTHGVDPLAVERERNPPRREQPELHYQDVAIFTAADGDEVGLRGRISRWLTETGTPPCLVSASITRPGGTTAIAIVTLPQRGNQ